MRSRAKRGCPLEQSHAHSSKLGLSGLALQLAFTYEHESNVNANPQLVQVKGKIIAFNNLYPNREMGTRSVLAIPEWVRRATGDTTKEK